MQLFRFFLFSITFLTFWYYLFMKYTISQFVKNKRKELDLTVIDFADRYGISHALVSQYESGSKDNPSVVVAAKFCRVFGISAEDFISNFKYSVSTINDTFGSIVSLQHRINGDTNKNGISNINRFISIYSEKNKWKDIKILNDIEKRSVFDDSIRITPSATCKTYKDEKICIIYFPYRSLPNNQSDTMQTYYQDYLRTISDIISHSFLPYDNYILLTSDKQAFSYIEAVKKLYIKSDKNITMVCEQYRKESKQIVITGKRFVLQ